MQTPETSFTNMKIHFKSHDTVAIVTYDVYKEIINEPNRRISNWVIPKDADGNGIGLIDCEDISFIEPASIEDL